MEQSTKLVFQVNKIIQMHLDRALGYHKAENLVEDKQLKLLFDQCAQQSYYCAEKLQAAMWLQGLETKSKPSFSGAIFRRWMKLRRSLCSKKDQSVLRCSLAGEKMIHLSYELLCSNKYLQYYFPLLKFTFLKQLFSLRKSREDLEAVLLGANQAMNNNQFQETPLRVLNPLTNETPVF